MSKAIITIEDDGENGVIINTNFEPAFEGLKKEENLTHILACAASKFIVDLLKENSKCEVEITTVRPEPVPAPVVSPDAPLEV